MPTLRQVVTFTFVFAMAGIGGAQAQGVAAGNYKLEVGHSAPCPITLSADGTATPGSDCKHVSSVTHWAPTSSGLQFQDNSGSTIAVLNAKGDAYQGATFEDNHQLVLTH